MTIALLSRPCRALLCAAALAACAAPAVAQTLTFDDVSTNAQGLNNNFTAYAGFNFFGFNVATTTSLGTGSNAVSGTRFALGREDLSAIYRTGLAFDFVDAWLSFREFDLTSPANAPAGITVVGYRAGSSAPVFEQFVTLTGTAQLFTFNFTNIEEVVFETEALTAGGRSQALALDNARLAVVPEPSTLLLFAAGGTTLLLLVRRSRRRS